MPIDTPDIEELIELLRSNPELRRKVFVALAPDEFLALPAKVERLAEQFAERFARIESLLERQAEEFVSYRRMSEERFARIEAALERQAQEFAAYRQASEERFARIEAALQALTESHNRVVEEFSSYREATNSRLDRIDMQIALLAEKIDRLVEWQKVRDVHIDDLRGWRLEMHYAKHIHAYLGKVMRRVRLLSPPDIEEQVGQALSGDEIVDIFSADIIARGRPLDAPDRDLYLVMEVSMVVDVNDVARARRRADLMRKAGYLCIAAVGGHDITEEAKLEAQHSSVLCALDGSLQGWDGAQGQAVSSGSV